VARRLALGAMLGDGAGMLATMFLPFRRCLDFRGRSRRSEFWWFLVLQLAVLLIAFSIIFRVPAITDAPGALVWVLGSHLAVFGLPVLALQVRRMHDQDRSGWWVLGFCLPYIGTGFVLYFMAQPGTWGPNRYGPDPRQLWADDLFD
jgi:uncharacterized membrane protein YhaH (DUF805 family)